MNQRANYVLRPNDVSKAGVFQPCNKLDALGVFHQNLFWWKIRLFGNIRKHLRQLCLLPCTSPCQAFFIYNLFQQSLDENFSYCG